MALLLPHRSTQTSVQRPGNVQLASSFRVAANPHLARTPLQPFRMLGDISWARASRADPSRVDRVGACVHVVRREGHVYGRGILSRFVFFVF